MKDNIQNQLFSIISDRFDAYGEISLIDDELSSLYINPSIASQMSGISNAASFFDRYVNDYVSFFGKGGVGFGLNYWMIKSKLEKTHNGFQFPYMVIRQDNTMWFRFTAKPVPDDPQKAYFMMENITGEMDMLQTIEAIDGSDGENSSYVYMLDMDNWSIELLSNSGANDDSTMNQLDFAQFAFILAKALGSTNNMKYDENDVKKYISVNLEKISDKITRFVLVNENGKFNSYKIEIRKASNTFSNMMALLRITSIDEREGIIEKQNLVMQRTRAAVRTYYSVMATVNFTANKYELIYADETNVKLLEYIDSYDALIDSIEKVTKQEQREDFTHNFSRPELIKEYKKGQLERNIELLMKFPSQDYKWFEIKLFFAKNSYTDDVTADLYFGLVDERVRVDQQKNSYYVGLDSIYDECLMLDLVTSRLYIYKSKFIKCDKDVVDITPAFMRKLIRSNIYEKDIYDFTKFLARSCFDRTKMKNGDRFFHDFRRKMPDGTIQWYKNIVTIYWDGHGKDLKALICWRNINNEMVQKDERESLQTKFITAVRSFFKIYEIETDTERVLRYDLSEQNRLNIVDTGLNWDEMDAKIRDEYIHPSQRTWYNLVLTKDNILKTLSGDNLETHTTMLMKSVESDEYKWSTLYCRKYRNKDGSFGLMIMIQDADEYVKEKEEKIEQIKESRRIAEQASKAKTRFLSNMTHNMKTPVNAILGLADIVSKNAFNTSLVSSNSRRIGESAKALNQIIDDVLDMSRIESGTLGLVTEEFSMSDTLMKAVEKAYVRTVDKNQTLKLTVGKYQHDKVIGDEHRVLQIFDSILSNAVKFTPEKGTISVNIEETVTELEGFICFQIVFEDTGIGMSRRFMKKLFQAFEQEKNDYAGNTEGNGLELAIVKSLLDLMNSEISVKSSLGEGTRMTLLLNLKPVNESPENINARELFATEYLNVSVIAKLNAEREPGTNFTGYKVLLVDDNEINNFVIKTFVEQTGATAVQAKNGREAYELIRDSEAYEYHLIFMDVMMPVMNGFEASIAIRNLGRPDTAVVPIIAVSANSSAEDIMVSLNSGMNKHISKPVECATIYRIMNEFLSSRR